MSRQQNRFSLTSTLLVCGSALYLYLNLFAWLRVPFLIGGDQVCFWGRAMRMLDGEHIYRDFLQFTPPGLDLLFLSLFKVFGLRMWVTNLIVLVLGLAFVWLVFSIASRFMRRKFAVLAAAVFLVPIYGKALNATHHWFGVLAVLVAIRVVLGGRMTWRLTAAGAILGLGSYFSTFHGLAGLLAFCVFLLWQAMRTQAGWAEIVRRQVLLFGAYVVALTLLYTHYLITGGSLGELWYFQVTYVRKYVVDAYRGRRLLFPLPVTLHNLPALSEYLVVYALLGTAIAAALYLCWKRRREAASIEPAVLVVLVAVFLFGEVAVSAWWLRIYAVSAPAVILLAWGIEQMPRQRVCVLILIWGWIVVLGAHQTWVHHRMQRAVIDLPAGRVATTQQMADGMRMVAEFAKPGEAVFQAAWPGVYLPLHVRNPVAFETVNISDMPRPGDVELLVRQLNDRRVPYVLWAMQLDSSCTSYPCNDRLTALRDSVHGAYVPVATLPDGDTLWRRRE